MRPLLALALVSLAAPAAANFGNFFQQAFFGGQQQQQHEPRRQREHKGWHEMHELPCRAGYVCPGALACVPTPADCPCPYPEDTKCVIPDERPRDEGEGPPFVCVRGECGDVLRFSAPI